MKYLPDYFNLYINNEISNHVKLNVAVYKVSQNKGAKRRGKGLNHRELRRAEWTDSKKLP